MNGALIILAGLFGLAGVALSALAAHAPGAANLATAAQFLLMHAPVLIGIAALRHQALASSRLLASAGMLLIAGVALFSGDLIARHLIGHGLFPMAAPTGGSLTMLGWLVLALAGTLRMIQRQD